MAISTDLISSFDRSKYDHKIRNYTGLLHIYSQVDVGYSPNSRYLVGYSFDAGDNQRGSMTVNGTMINDSYTAGSGSFRKANGLGVITVGNGGLISWQGGGTTRVVGALRTFAVRIR